MQKVEQLKRRIKSAEDLESIVRSMKVISSANIHQFDQAVESLEEYFRTIESALHIVLSKSTHESLDLGTDQGLTGIIILGANQGLCGPFDDAIAEFMRNALAEKEILNPELMVLGERVFHHMKYEGRNVSRIIELPRTVSKIQNTVNNLIQGITDWRENRNISEVLIFHNKPETQGKYSPYVQRLLPLDKEWLQGLTHREWPTNNIPKFSMSPTALLSALIRQYLFVSLYRAVAASLAAEHTSRLNSMQVAEKKIRDWMDKLQLHYRQERHASITEELLDIMAGYEAVTTQNS